MKDKLPKEQATYLQQARASLYNVLDPLHMGPFIQRREGFWDLIWWAYQNRELFSGKT